MKRFHECTQEQRCMAPTTIHAILSLTKAHAAEFNVLRYAKWWLGTRHALQCVKARAQVQKRCHRQRKIKKAIHV
jgi:hypothetical protein